ncbi:MAG: phosphomannomutase/phosphoglucomutase [Duodenibacillus sp.]|nr:phosphomannomutase/phosphoglucomutase [Duodenibacillus sp.]
MQADRSIFKAYDIRGIVGKALTEEVVHAVGMVLGAMARERGVGSLCVGRDGRLSGPALSAALMRGMADAGADVKDIGMCPTPVLYFATKHLGNGSGVAVTGSHNPADYNGLKMMMGGLTLFGDDIQGIYERLGTVAKAAVPGRIEQVDVLPAYVAKVLSDVRLARPMKVAVDAGNGVGGPTAVQIIKGLGCEVEELYTDVDGRFPHHHPDPSKPANLQDLAAALKAGDAEVGLAFDGDADRLGVVTRSGQIIYPDRQMMLFAADILERNPGKQIIYDVKCTRKLVPWIRDRGGVPTISCTGHSLVKARLRETGAPFAGEMSGHLFFNDGRWPGFDDGVYAAARMLEILSRCDDPSAALEALPTAVNTPELQIAMREGENKAFIEKIRAAADFPEAEDIILIDGLRVEFKDGFALARSSNTTPVVVLRLEGDTPEALERIKARFGAFLKGVDGAIELPF